MGILYDIYDQWCRHEAEQEKHLKQQPVCADCDDHIQPGHYYQINDEAICPDCLDSNYRKETEDYFE